MNYRYKTRKNLIKELRELQLEYDSVKTSYEKEIIERKQVAEALEFTRMILDNAADTMVCIDYDGRYIDFNEALCRSVGYSREELLSMTVHDIDPNYPAGIWREFWDKLKQAGSLEFESLHLTKDERLVPVEVTVSHFEHNGKEYHCGFARDITERKQTEDALRQSEMKLKTLFEVLPVGVSIIDAERNIAFFNPALERILNMTKDGLIRGDYKNRKYIRPDGTQMPEEEYASVLAIREQRAVHDVETGVLIEDGHVVWTNVNAAPVAFPDWKVVIITADITERKLTEKALRESEILYRELIDLARDAIFLLTPQGLFGSMNQAFEKITGWQMHEWIGKPFTDLLHPEDIPLAEERFSNLLKGRTVQAVELRVQKKSGDYTWIEVLASPRIKDGMITGLLGIGRDITERKQTEEALKNLLSLTEATLESIHNGILVISLQRTVIKANARFAEMWRIPGDILNSGDDKKLLDNVLGQLADPDAFIDKVEELYEKPEAESFDLIYFRDGRIFERISRPMYLGGEPKGRVWSFLDITNRKHAEKALSLEKENFRHSLDDSPLGVRIAAIEGNTIYANKTLLNFYGYDSLGELQKTPLKDRYTPESYLQAQKRKRQRERGDLSATDYEISIVRKNGEIRHLQVFRKEVLWDDVRQFQVICNDITERKMAEEELRKSKKLLEDLHRHLNEILENERALISREIHDQIGQSLTALKLDLNWMHTYININPEAAAKLKGMIELVSNTIKDVQRISSDLRPGILDDLGLAAAIEWYSGEFEERTGIKCSLKVDDSRFGDSQKNLVFFRVLQEALTNVIRHANASSVRIKLHQSKLGTTMTIRDNGTGMHPGKAESAKSLGLIGMRERVRQFEGKVNFSSKKGEGTKLTIFIPTK